MSLAVRPRARVRSATALLALTVTLTVGACAAEADPRAPERAPSARPGPTEPAAADLHTDRLARPASWPAELAWPPVDGRVADHVAVPDGSVRLVIELDSEAPAPRTLARRWTDQLEATAHAVSATADWRGARGESVIVALHPQRLIETRLSREAAGQPLRVQILLTPLPL